MGFPEIRNWRESEGGKEGGGGMGEGSGSEEVNTRDERQLLHIRIRIGIMYIGSRRGIGEVLDTTFQMYREANMRTYILHFRHKQTSDKAT